MDGNYDEHPHSMPPAKYEYDRFSRYNSPPLRQPPSQLGDRRHPRSLYDPLERTPNSYDDSSITQQESHGYDDAPEHTYEYDSLSTKHYPHSRRVIHTVPEHPHHHKPPPPSYLPPSYPASTRVGKFDGQHSDEKQQAHDYTPAPRSRPSLPSRPSPPSYPASTQVEKFDGQHSVEKQRFHDYTPAPRSRPLRPSHPSPPSHPIPHRNGNYNEEFFPPPHHSAPITTGRTMDHTQRRSNRYDSPPPDVSNLKPSPPSLLPISAHPPPIKPRRTSIPLASKRPRKRQQSDDGEQLLPRQPHRRQRPDYRELFPPRQPHKVQRSNDGLPGALDISASSRTLQHNHGSSSLLVDGNGGVHHPRNIPVVQHTGKFEHQPWNDDSVLPPSSGQLRRPVPRPPIRYPSRRPPKSSPFTMQLREAIRYRWPDKVDTTEIEKRAEKCA